MSAAVTNPISSITSMQSLWSTIMGADSASWGPFMGGFEGVHVAPLTLPTSSGGWWEGWSLHKYHTPARVTRKPISGPQETRRVHACAQVWLRHLFVSEDHIHGSETLEPPLLSATDVSPCCSSKADPG